MELLGGKAGERAGERGSDRRAPFGWGAVVGRRRRWHLLCVSWRIKYPSEGGGEKEGATC